LTPAHALTIEAKRYGKDRIRNVSHYAKEALQLFWGPPCVTCRKNFGSEKHNSLGNQGVLAFKKVNWEPRWQHILEEPFGKRGGETISLPVPKKKSTKRHKEGPRFFRNN